jgi:hypothetical protein
MSRWVVPAGGLIAGAILGALLMLAVQGSSAELASTTTTLPELPSPSSTDASGVTTTPKEPPRSDQVLLVWTPGGLPPGFGEAVDALEGVVGVTIVRSDLIHIVSSAASTGPGGDLAPGFVIPLEVMAFDSDTYQAFISKMDAGLFNSLEANEILLGATSARLRGLEGGDLVTLEGGRSLTVAGVVDDVLIGAAEGAVRVRDADQLGVTTERYLLIRHQSSRVVVEMAVRSLLGPDTAVRVRAPGETPVLRHGDAVLPQVLIKEHFGEFAYRPRGDGSFEIDRGWLEANIVTVDVPLLGPVTCHRNLVSALIGAMTELEESNLGFLVEPEGSQGCFNPRFIANRRDISRHAWGAAIDINIGTNPAGIESAQDPRLLAIMERWGFTSGHDWLIPDPGHFEYLRPAAP